MTDPTPAGPALVCPGCGSPHVDIERGLLFCGACAETVDLEGGGSDE